MTKRFSSLNDIDAKIAVTMEVYNHITEYVRIENEILKMEDLMVV